jgi:hypothetical protein
MESAKGHLDAYCNKLSAAMGGWGLELVWWFLAAAIAIGVAGAVMALVEKLAALWAPDGGGGAHKAVPVNTLLDSIGKLIEALTKAPVWIAMFAAGLALLWVSADAVSTACTPPAKQDGQAPNKPGPKQGEPQKDQKQPEQQPAGNASAPVQ